MGFPMAGHLSKEGYNVIVYNRSEEKSKLWIKNHIGTYSTSIKEAVSESDIVFSCVGNDSDLRDITLGEDKAFAAMKAASAASCAALLPDFIAASQFARASSLAAFADA